MLVGTANNLEYKIRFAAAILLDVAGSGLSSTDRGTLDVSQQDSSGGIRPTFNSAAAPTPTPAPTEPRLNPATPAKGTPPAAPTAAPTRINLSPPVCRRRFFSAAVQPNPAQRTQTRGKR